MKMFISQIKCWDTLRKDIFARNPIFEFRAIFQTWTSTYFSIQMRTMNDVSGHGFDHFAHENSIYTIYEKNNALKQYGKDLIK